MRKVIVGLCALLVAVSVVGMIPKQAHAESLWKDVVDKVIRDVVKNLYHHPEWSDEQLKDNLDKTIDHVVNETMDSDSEGAKQAISNHCWRVYVTAWHPDVYAGRWYFEYPVPGDYLNADELGNTSIWDQLNVCVRTGYAPMSPYEEGAIDIQ